MGLESAIPIFGSLFRAGSDKKAADAINPVYTPYNINPLANLRLGAAQLNLNGQMAGAQEAKNNIATNQANTIGAAGRAATDPNQLLSIIGAAQGQSNTAYGGLATQEAQDYYSKLNNLTQAQQGVISEGDKVYQDRMNKYNIDQQRKDEYNKAADANDAAFGNDIVKVGMMAATGGASAGLGAAGGGLGGIFRKKNMFTGVPTSDLYDATQ